MLSKDSSLPCQPFCLISYMIPFLFSGFKLLLLLTSLLPQNLSTSQRPLCVVGRLGRKKKKARGARWEGEREKRGLFPFSHLHLHAFFFSIIAIFIGIPSGRLCRGESCKTTVAERPGKTV